MVLCESAPRGEQVEERVGGDVADLCDRADVRRDRCWRRSREPCREDRAEGHDAQRAAREELLLLVERGLADV
eukprot:6428459-Prymnesium_polylepis.1